MLRCIPTISADGLNAYFDTINSKLLVYENYEVNDIRDEQEYYIYTGREADLYPDCPWLHDGKVPEDVIHVIVHLSVKAIKYYAFWDHRELVTVILNDGLEEIGYQAFFSCTFLEPIVIPNSIRTIMDGAFSNCSGLMTVTLGDGLEEIGEEAFYKCTSLESIIIPPAVKAIKKQTYAYCLGLTTVTLNEGLEQIGETAFERCTWLECIVTVPAIRAIKQRAFKGCSGLTTVTLGNGLEEIGYQAFCQCTSLERIVIPPAIKAIDDSTLRGCSNLTNVEFCKKIKEFVSCEVMRDWWNQGVHEKSLSTYCFLVQCSIPDCLGLVLVRIWQANIHEMMGRIPTVSTDGLNAYFDTIDSKLAIYKDLSELPLLLELAILNNNIVLCIPSFI
jgi:hypothetical protein